MPRPSPILIGVDTGGTFTDLVLSRGGRVLSFKVPSTPSDFARGIVAGITALFGNAAISAGTPFDLVHSSTVATNALLERKGARLALITTKGFRDVLEIGRQNRPELYNLHVRRPRPLVPRALRHEVDERVGAGGKILKKLDGDDVERLLDRLARQRITTLAVCLLFAFEAPAHEKLIGRLARRRGWLVSLSSDIAPEFREYERTSTTVINAYIVPIVRAYVRRLSRQARRLGARSLRIVQSNGGSLSARAACERPVHTLLSGPAAGVTGAVAMARQALSPRHRRPPAIITFDMGGTSTDVCLVAGDVRIDAEGHIGDFPVRMPMMDMHTVGAGGGSIAGVDAGGALYVGPQSAGAEPGPACYGSGSAPTVTDANVFLRRIHPAYFLDGRMALDTERSAQAMREVGRAMHTDARTAALSVLAVVNANMERAIRKISIERGHDPRVFTLVSFGGAGGLHACDIADALHMTRVLVPVHPGVLSAWGALCGDVVKDYARTVMLAVASPRTPNRLHRELQRLSNLALDEMKQEGYPADSVRLSATLDVRYIGQSHELNVPAGTRIGDAVVAFHRRHQERYGHCEPEEPVEIVTARVRAAGATAHPTLRPIARRNRRSAAAPQAQWHGSRLYQRDRLRAGETLSGSALVVEPFATTRVPRNWKAVVTRHGHLVLSRSESHS